MVFILIYFPGSRFFHAHWTKGNDQQQDLLHQVLEIAPAFPSQIQSPNISTVNSMRLRRAVADQDWDKSLQWLTLNSILQLPEEVCRNHLFLWTKEHFQFCHSLLINIATPVNIFSMLLHGFHDEPIVKSLSAEQCPIVGHLG